MGVQGTGKQRAGRAGKTPYEKTKGILGEEEKG